MSTSDGNRILKVFEVYEILLQMPNLSNRHFKLLSTILKTYRIIDRPLNALTDISLADYLSVYFAYPIPADFKNKKLFEVDARNQTRELVAVVNKKINDFDSNKRLELIAQAHRWYRNFPLNFVRPVYSFELKSELDLLLEGLDNFNERFARIMPAGVQILSLFTKMDRSMLTPINVNLLTDLELTTTDYQHIVKLSRTALID